MDKLFCGPNGESSLTCIFFGSVSLWLHSGDDYNSWMCDNDDTGLGCPMTITTPECFSAVLVYFEGDGFMKDGCEYSFYAEFVCSGKNIHINTMFLVYIPSCTVL